MGYALYTSHYLLKLAWLIHLDSSSFNILGLNQTDDDLDIFARVLAKVTYRIGKTNWYLLYKI